MVSYNCVLDIEFNEDSITEPVTLEEAKNFCKIDIDTDDDLLDLMITSAREMCEDFTNIGFVQHEVVAVINNGNGGVLLPYGPTGEITEITDSNDTVLDEGTGYTLSGNLFKSILTPKADNLTVTYATGYEVLPMRLKLAVLNQIYFLYDNRSQTAVKDSSISPITAMILKPVSRVI
jgi:hypothetical protein